MVLEIKTREPKQIGIEITEAVSQFGAYLEAKFNQSGDLTGTYLVPENKSSAQRLPKKEFKKLIEGQKHPRPIMGDAVERNWKEAILGTVKKKVDAFNKPCFKCYRNNWLLIYDNWSPAPPSWEVQGVTIELSQFLFANDWQQPFDRVFVLSSERMWEFREDVIPISYRVKAISKRFYRTLPGKRRRLRGFRQLGKVIEGVKFKGGIETKQFDNQVAA